MSGQRSGLSVSVPVSGQLEGGNEKEYAIDAIKSGQWSYGFYNKELEKRLREYVGVRHALLCNSGSSADLIAISALTSPKLGDKALKPGDRVVTTACSFPTTVNPLYLKGLKPVYVDVDLHTLNASADAVINAAVITMAKAVVLTHTLGNPFEADKIREFCDEYGLWFVEDNCDALGSEIDGKKTGTFGHFATQSFYPAHHISTGEGGAILTNSPKLYKLAQSFRDWGKDCWCPPGYDNTCGKRFGWQLGDLPSGYDHKYIFSHLGYNLKMSNVHAALGVGQMEHIEEFVNIRRGNHRYLKNRLRGVSDIFYFQDELQCHEPSWFGFALTLRKYVEFTRKDIVDYLESRGIATRTLFGGNLLKQPAYIGLDHWESYLKNTDYVMNNTFWVGCWPGLGIKHMDIIIEALREFINEKVST